MKFLRPFFWGLIASVGATQANAATIHLTFSGEFAGGDGDIDALRVVTNFSGQVFFDTEAPPDSPGASTQVNYSSSVIAGSLTLFGESGPNHFIFDGGGLTVANGSPSGSDPDRFSWNFNTPRTGNIPNPDFFVSSVFFTINGADSILSDLSLDGAADALRADAFPTSSTAINVFQIRTNGPDFLRGSAFGDITSYEASVFTIPEPSASLLLGLVSVGFLFRRMR